MKVLWFLIKEGFRNLLRSKFAGAFTILIIWFSLTFVSFGYIISRDLVSAVNSLKSQFDISFLSFIVCLLDNMVSFTNQILVSILITTILKLNKGTTKRQTYIITS
mgnify:CR=1 FL=1